MEENKICDLCKSKRLIVLMPPHECKTLVTGKEMMTATIGVVMCSDCGYVLLSPRMDKKGLVSFYECQSKYTRSFEELKKSSYAILCDMQFEFIKENCGETFQRVLEVGSAEGCFLSILSDKGLNVEGIEPSFAYEEYYTKNIPNVKVHLSTLEAAKLQESHYSLCVLRHVLEHVISPLSTLKLVYKLLKDKGHIYIEVPNLARAQVALYDYFHLEHISYFTLHTLRYACELSGFKIIRVEQWDNNPKDSGINYPVLRVIAQKDICNLSSDIISPDHTISLDAFNNYSKRREAILSNYYISLKSDILKWYKFGKRIAIFGGGPHTADLLQILDIPENIFICAFDNDQRKWGKRIGQIQIESPKEVIAYDPDIVIISSYEYENEIAKGIESWKNKGIKIQKIYNL